jgi:hypothetical protein
MWGGRLNPFIPVNDNIIDPDYFDLLKATDPDLVYYTAGCDKEKLISQIPFLHPYEFVELPINHGSNLPGLYAGYLITNDLHSELFTIKDLAIMHFQPGITHFLTSYYELSFGFGPMYIEDKAVARNYNAISVTEADIPHLSLDLRTKKPFPTALLSEEKCSNIIFRATNDWEAKQIEIIVYDEANPFNDLIYFWNRRLFQTGRRQLHQLIISKNQLTELAKEDHFGAHLYDLFFTSHLSLNSKTIDRNELSDLCKTINATLKRITFGLAAESKFPYKFDQTNLSLDPRDTSFKLMLRGASDYISPPPPLPNLPIHNVRANYVLDVALVTKVGMLDNYIKFPHYTQTHHLVSAQKSRINQWHNLSFFIDTAVDKGFTIRVPDQQDIIRTRIMERNVFKESISVPVAYPRVSTAGMKLRSFVDLFKEEWYTIDSFTGDSFYLRLCLRNSLFKKANSYEMQRITDGEPERFHVKLPRSNITSTIDSFNQLDLHNELKHYYYRYREKLKDSYRIENVEITDEYLMGVIDKSIDEDFDLHINNDLQDLVERQALYMGMRVKCNNCGSNYWYSLKQLDNVMSCQGCHKQLSPSVTAPVAYKFNSVIINNLRSNSGVTESPYDGNYIVLRTLIHLATTETRIHNSFLYSPCLDIEMTEGKKTTNTDLDILAVVNGKLIIGEAKPRATDFDKKQIEQLIWIGKNIKPDKVILAYSKGKIDEKIQAISTAIDDPAVQVISYRVPDHWHRFGRIFGCSEKEEDDEVVNNKKKNI